MQQIKRNWNIVRKRWAQALLFALVWAVFLTAHACAVLLSQGWQNTLSILKIAAIVFAGALLGGFLGWCFSILLSVHRIAPKRFATGFVLILLATVAATSGLFTLQYRIYYSQWHHSAFSIGWAVQLLFTTASSLYLFAVQGLRLLLPFGPVLLVAASLVFVKATKPGNIPGD